MYVIIFWPVRNLKKKFFLGVNPCAKSNGGCTNLCIARPGESGNEVSRTCLCPDGMGKQMLQDGNEKCICPHGENLQPNGTCRRLSGDYNNCLKIEYKLWCFWCTMPTWHWNGLLHLKYIHPVWKICEKCPPEGVKFLNTPTLRVIFSLVLSQRE